MIDPIYFSYYDLNCLNDIEYSGRRTAWKTYQFQGQPIPRVSDILDLTCDSSWLVKWAMNNRRARSIQRQSLSVGTVTHSRIENFLRDGVDIQDDYNQLDYESALQVDNAVRGFKNWYYYTTKNLYKKLHIYTMERPILTPWYGGTTDCLIGIIDTDGKETKYVLDFKTSKVVSPNYFLQTYSYFWGLMYEKYVIGNHMIPDFDGLAILRVSKDKSIGEYEYRTIEFTNPKCLTDVANLKQAFENMIHWYYAYIKIR